MIRSRTSWKARDHVFTIGERTLIMGVLNVTPDSFSDGGKFLDPDAAVERAMELEAQGADIIDIGAESTRPGSERINAGEELRRLVPVLKRLKGRLTVPVSVDTYKVEVAEKALEHGASIINDVSALTWEPDLVKPVLQADAGLILNHMRGTPATWARLSPVKDIVGMLVSELEAAIHRATRGGIPRDHVVIDPGIGFGKRGEQNFEILARLGELLRLGVPVLAAASRKSFLGNAEDAQALEFATAAAVTSAILQGAAIVRVHDVAAMKPVVQAADAIFAAIPERDERARATTAPTKPRTDAAKEEERRRKPIRPVVAAPPPPPPKLIDPVVEVDEVDEEEVVEQEVSDASPTPPPRRPFERPADSPERKPLDRKAPSDRKIYEPRPDREPKERRPFERRSEEGKPERRPFQRRDDERSGPPSRGPRDDRERKPFPRRDDQRSGPPARGRDERERKPFQRRDDDRSGPPSRGPRDDRDRKPFQRRDDERSGPPARGRDDRERKPYQRRDDERSGPPSRGPRDDRERKPYQRRDDQRSGSPARGRDDRKPFELRDDRPPRGPFRRDDDDKGGRPGGRPSGPRRDDRPPFGGPKRSGGGSGPGGRGPTKRPGGGPPKGPRKRT